jgi:hypothetical protein
LAAGCAAAALIATVIAIAAAVVAREVMVWRRFSGYFTWILPPCSSPPVL